MGLCPIGLCDLQDPALHLVRVEWAQSTRLQQSGGSCNKVNEENMKTLSVVTYIYIYI